MRLWQLLFLVVPAVAIAMAICREPAGVAFLIVFATGLGEVVVGLASVMALFQTVGAFGEAKGFFARVEAMTATTVVLSIATGLMSGCFFCGFWLISRLV